MSEQRLYAIDESAKATAYVRSVMSTALFVPSSARAAANAAAQGVYVMQKKAKV